FVFQAEDGIRHFHVTGVQTCALPISCGKAIFFQSAATKSARRNCKSSSKVKDQSPLKSTVSRGCAIPNKNVTNRTRKDTNFLNIIMMRFTCSYLNFTLLFPLSVEVA